ncbi:MAG: glutathione S-transferase family protein [Woeseiaceae bacterium]|nr:glutathione S-transferase family protein [Woeseiaceae bacterium]
MSNTIRFYGDSRSGNCFKLKLACAELEIDYDWEEVDILAGETRTPEFLARNANGKIPLAELPDGRYLAESNAILSYLADGTPLGGTDRWARAEILQWLFFEQYSHEPNIATSRFIIRYLGNPPDRQAALAEKQSAGYRALDVMERRLDDRAYFVGEAFTIADIGLFAYTHVADEGGFSLDGYPGIRRWIERIRGRERFVSMTS